jgi:hypothetical protein
MAYQAAQHSVRPIPKEHRGHGGGSLRVFGQLFPGFVSYPFPNLSLSSRQSRKRLAPFPKRSCFYATLREEYTMTIQSSTQIGDVIRNAVVFNIKNWLGGMMNSDSLIQSVQDFFTLLEQRKIDYVLGGGIATLHYIEGRNTQDMGVLMAVSSLEKLPELRVSSQDMDFVRASYNELQIDILLTQNPLFKKVHSQYSKVEQFLDRNIPLATVEGLLLLKLYALPSLYRQGNFARVGIYENDIATLLHDYQTDMPALLNELSNHVNENDLIEIKGVISDIQNRIQRFKNESS